MINCLIVEFLGSLLLLLILDANLLVIYCEESHNGLSKSNQNIQHSESKEA